MAKWQSGKVLEGVETEDDLRFEGFEISEEDGEWEEGNKGTSARMPMARRMLLAMAAWARRRLDDLDMVEAPG